MHDPSEGCRVGVGAADLRSDDSNLLPVANVPVGCNVEQLLKSSHASDNHPKKPKTQKEGATAGRRR
jgi:hypothetical protein